MPTRPKKGSTPHQNTSGRTNAGGQKAVYGSARSPEVVDEATKAVGTDPEEQASPDEQ
jgi:hypothetical protein